MLRPNSHVGTKIELAYWIHLFKKYSIYADFSVLYATPSSKENKVMSCTLSSLNENGFALVYMIYLSEESRVSGHTQAC